MVIIEFNSLPEPEQVKAKQRIFHEICIEYKNMGIPLREYDAHNIVMSRIENKIFYTDDYHLFFIIDRFKDRL
jgi:hypothetical protein